MDRQAIEALIMDPDERDYGIYLNVKKLLDCQKPLATLANRDELQFQIVHQVEELWMKLMAYTLIEIEEAMVTKATPRALTLFRRVALMQQLMIDQLDLLETMSPKDYQTIRLQLGNGSGQESPGFQLLLKMAPMLWSTFQATYLEGGARTVSSIYDQDYHHDDAYMIAEALLDFDELFQKFRWHHIFLIHRSIGMGAASLKGRSVDLLQAGARHRFYPELWDIRASMTDTWGGTYGLKRDSLGESNA